MPSCGVVVLSVTRRFFLWIAMLSLLVTGRCRNRTKVRTGYLSEVWSIGTLMSHTHTRVPRLATEHWSGLSSAITFSHRSSVTLCGCWLDSLASNAGSAAMLQMELSNRGNRGVTEVIGPIPLRCVLLLLNRWRRMAAHGSVG